MHSKLQTRTSLMLGLIIAFAMLQGCGGAPGGSDPPPTFNPTAIGYVAVTKGNSVTSFLLDEATGQMVPGTTVPAGAFTLGPVVTPDKKLLFVANGEDGTISRFMLDGNGGMQPLGPVTIASGEQPWYLAVAPSGRFLYAGTTSSAVAGFSINPQNGDLLPLPNSPFAVPSTAYAITLSHSGEFLYALAESSDAFHILSVDQVTGALTQIGTAHIGYAPCAFVIDPADKFLFVNACVGRLLVFRITSSGLIESTPVSDSLSAFLPSTIAIAPNGKLVYIDDSYGQGPNGGGLIDNGILGFSFDSVTGSVTPMAGSPFFDGQSPSGVAVSPRGTTLICTRINPGHIASYRINADGSLTSISGNLSDSGIPTGSSPNRALIVSK